MEWLSNLITTFTSLFPHLILIRKTHGAVRFGPKGGIKVLYPGIHLYWPVIHEIQVIAVERQTINLATQTVLTADDYAVAASGVVVYRIRDVEAAVARSFEVEETIADLALAAVAGTIAESDLDDLMDAHVSGALTTTLTARVADALHCYGVGVERCLLSDFATCRVFRLIGETPHEGPHR